MKMVVFSCSTITLKSVISEPDPHITLSATRDGITAIYKFNIYIPTQRVSVVSEQQTMKQGEMLQLGVKTVPDNASLDNLEFFLTEDSKKYAEISSDGILKANILLDIPYSTVCVYAKIDDIVSATYTVAIEKPTVVLFADQYYPTSSDIYGDAVKLTTLKDGVVQNTGVEYVIKSGGEFIDGAIEDGILRIKTAIPTFDPQIILSAKVGAFETGDIFINVKILAQSIQFENADVIGVEQQRSYSFKGSILPSNAALVHESLTYSLNVDEDVAEIDSNGLLTVKADAPIGQDIVITVLGPDDVIETHKVRVVTVYAEKLEITGVYKSDGTELDTDNLALPGDRIHFNVIFPEPFNVTDAQKVYSLLLLEGDTDVATIEDNVLVINWQIAKSSPTFIVRVYSDQNEAVIYQDYIVNVYIPVTKVELSAISATANEGSRVSINDLIKTDIYPLSSNVRLADYVLVDGDQYVELDGNYLVIDDKVSSGDLFFSIRAVAEGIESNTVVIGIYVKTESLTVSASNHNPQSRIEFGETVELTSTTDERATMNHPTITVLSGAEYIDGKYQNGDIIPSVFDLKKNLTQVGIGAIKLKAEQDGVTCLLDDIIIYIPVESFSLGFPDRADRDSTITLTPIYNGSKDNHVTVPRWELVNVEGLATVTGDKLYISKAAPAGSVIVVSYKSVETGIVQRDRITVNSLKNSFSLVYGASPVYPSEYSIGYGDVIKPGYNNVAINQNLQIEEGGYTDIKLKYNGQNLSEFGITNYCLEILSGADCAESTTLGGGEVRLQIKSGTSGKRVVIFRMKITDGNTTHSSDTLQLNVFKRYTDLTVQTNIFNKVTTLSATADDASSEVLNKKFDTSVAGSGCSLSETGTFTILSSTATYNPVIKLTANQTYNGITYPIEKSYSLSIPYIQIIDDSDCSPSHIIAISGISDTVTPPVRSGYRFAGYYTNRNGGGVRCYSHTGRALYNYYSSSTKTIYTYWLDENISKAYSVGSEYSSGGLGTDFTEWKTVDTVSNAYGSNYNFALLKEIGYSKISFSYSFYMDVFGSIEYNVRLLNASTNTVLAEVGNYDPGNDVSHNRDLNWETDLSNIHDGDVIVIQMSYRKTVLVWVGDFKINGSRSLRINIW